MIEEKVVEKTGEIVLGAAINKLNAYKNKKEWSKLFIDAGEIFLKQVEGGENIVEDMSALLSKENMKELAKKTDEGSRYLLKDALHREMRSLMLRYEIAAQEAELYISHFMTVIMHELEKEAPTVYQKAYLGEWREQEEKQLAEIKKSINLVNTQLREIQSRKVEVYSLDQQEIELAKQTANPSLNLSFFEIDDEVFKEAFEERIGDECIYVSGQCKEETIYCVLNELRRLNTGKVIFVVRKEEDWQNLRQANEENTELGGKILIPWFNAEQIYAIPNNTNIFVYGEEEYCVGKKSIKVRKRKRSTIAKKLEEVGVTHEVAYAMVEDTHGLYVPLKKKIIRGKYNIVPNWVDGEENLIIPLLLCGQWTEAEGDQVVLEQLCGRKYEQIIEDIKPYMKGEEPLFIRFKIHGGVVYHLASVENAWDYLDNKVVIGDKRWTSYVSCVLEIISEPDPVFNFPQEQQDYAGLLPGGKPFWTGTLKEGLLRSFIMKAYYKKDVNSQKEIDRVVEKLLTEIKTLNQWLSIAKYFSILCEASPKAVIRRLDDEWTNATGLVEVFSRDKGDRLFGTNYYTHFIWGIEQFLSQKEYAAWAVRWFLKMHDLKIKYAISNSPKETLKQIFCAWCNVTVLSQEDKNFLAKEAFDNGHDIWELIYDELPGRNSHMVGSPSKPRYRTTEEPIIATYADLRCAYKEYLLLCLKHMDFDSERWIKIIKAANHFGEELRSKIFEKLEYELSYMDDMEIISIKNAIRNEIFRHRYFVSSEWAMKEEEVKGYEEVLNNINTKNPVYEYQYLFKEVFRFPLLHPCPYSKDEKREINDQLREREIEEGVLRFKENELNIKELVEICSKCEHSTLGKYLFDIYSDKIFDENLFLLLISDEAYKDIMDLYLRTAYWKDKTCLSKAVTIAKEHHVDEELLINILVIEEIDAEKIPLISYENERIKKKYWKWRNYSHKDDEETCRFIIKEMMKYSDQVTLMDALHRYVKYFRPEEILVIMEDLYTLERGEVTSMAPYALEEILKVLQSEYSNTKECMRVARLELAYRGGLEWDDMRCFRKCLESSPKMYAELISIVYKKDSEDVQEQEKLDEKVVSSIFSLLHNVIFCPAELDGDVDKEKLFKWVDKFGKLLKQQHQERLFTSLLGTIFSNSPIGEDGYYPHESIREAIQQYGDERLENAYVIGIFNQRGIFSPTGGVEERGLAKKYKENADVVRTRYPKVASIYDKLCERYLYDADSERELEEYAGI